MVNGCPLLTIRRSVPFSSVRWLVLLNSHARSQVPMSRAEVLDMNKEELMKGEGEKIQLGAWNVNLLIYHNKSNLKTLENVHQSHSICRILKQQSKQQIVSLLFWQCAVHFLNFIDTVSWPVVEAYVFYQHMSFRAERNDRRSTGWYDVLLLPFFFSRVLRREKTIDSLKTFLFLFPDFQFLF